MQKKKKLIFTGTIMIIILLLGFVIYFQKRPSDKSEGTEKLKDESIVATDSTDGIEEYTSEDTDELIEEDAHKPVSNAEQTTSNTPSLKTPEKTEKPQVCQHTYAKDGIESNCSSDGYIKYTCTKCAYTYTEVIPAQHQYGKYICYYCGKIDPEANKVIAMSTWIQTYGQLNGAGSIYHCYPSSGNSSLNIYSHVGSSYFNINYYNEATQEQFTVALQSTTQCHVSFAKGSTRGSFSIENALLSSSHKVVFSSFYTSDDSPVDEETFAAECAKKIDEYMLRAQNEIIYPKTGLKLRDFGFKCY